MSTNGSNNPGGNDPGGGNDGTGANGDGDGGELEVPALSADDTFYRCDTLKLILPHLVTKPLGTKDPAFQTDITGSAQGEVNKALVEDNEPNDEGDGYVDLNAMIRFLGKVDTSQPGGFVTAGAGLCPFPYDASQVCGPLKLGPFQDTAAYSNGKDCTLEGSSEMASGSCFAAAKGPRTVNIQLIGPVPLEDTQVIGAWADAGKAGIEDGWIRGFLPEDVAMATKLPEQVPLAALALGIRGGAPLSDFLADKDKQQSPPGWWFTLKYTAKPALYDASVGPDGEK